MNGKALPLPTSKSSPSLAHDGAGGLPPAPMDDMRGEHKSPFELRALEVALDVVSPQQMGQTPAISAFMSSLVDHMPMGGDARG